MNKKILIGGGILLVAGVALFGIKGLDGQTVWQRFFGKRTDPKKPTEPKSNAVGFPPDGQGKCPRGYKLGGDKLCHENIIYNADGCSCSDESNSSKRIIRITNVRANAQPNVIRK